MSVLSDPKSLLRRRGADLTQGLLYAAFAIVVLITVLSVYQVVMMAHQKNEVARLMSIYTAEIRVQMKATPSDQIGAFDRAFANLAMSPSVQKDIVYGPYNFSHYALPYGGSIHKLATPGNTDRFSLAVNFGAESRGARALCTFLGSGGVGEIINGPMGSDYRIVRTQCGEGQQVLSVQVAYSY